MEHQPQAGIKHAEQFIYLLMTQKYKCLNGSVLDGI